LTWFGSRDVDILVNLFKSVVIGTVNAGPTAGNMGYTASRSKLHIKRAMNQGDLFGKFFHINR
jgi:hypothetical protein